MSEWEKWRDDIVLNFCDDHQFVALEATKDLLDAAYDKSKSLEKDRILTAIKDLTKRGYIINVSMVIDILNNLAPTPPTAGEKEEKDD